MNKKLNILELIRVIEFFGATDDALRANNNINDKTIVRKAKKLLLERLK